MCRHMWVCVSVYVCVEVLTIWVPTFSLCAICISLYSLHPPFPKFLLQKALRSEEILMMDKRNSVNGEIPCDHHRPQQCEWSQLEVKLLGLFPPLAPLAGHSQSSFVKGIYLKTYHLTALFEVLDERLQVCPWQAEWILLLDVLLVPLLCCSIGEQDFIWIKENLQYISDSNYAPAETQMMQLFLLATQWQTLFHLSNRNLIGPAVWLTKSIRFPQPTTARSPCELLKGEVNENVAKSCIKHQSESVLWWELSLSYYFWPFRY